MTPDQVAQKREVVAAILDHYDEAARMIRELGEPRLSAYLLADLEGRDGDWLGENGRDILVAWAAELGGDPEPCDDFVPVMPESRRRVPVVQSRCQRATCGRYFADHDRDAQLAGIATGFGDVRELARLADVPADLERWLRPASDR